MPACIKGLRTNTDGLLKNLEKEVLVIPAKAGILLFQVVIKQVDSGLRQNDDFLRDHQYCSLNDFQQFMNRHKDRSLSLARSQIEIAHLQVDRRGKGAVFP